MRVLSHISASEEAMQAKKVPKNSHFSSSSPPLSPSASRIGRSKEYELKSTKIKLKERIRSLNSPSFRLKSLKIEAFRFECCIFSQFLKFCFLSFIQKHLQNLMQKFKNIINNLPATFGLCDLWSSSLHLGLWLGC